MNTRIGSSLFRRTACSSFPIVTILGLMFVICPLGCKVEKDGPQTQSGENTANTAPADQNAPVTAPPPEEGGSIIGRKTNEIHDARIAEQDPNIQIVKQKVTGVDPLSQATSTYSKGASFAGSLPIQQHIQHYKALNGKNPPYAELVEWVKQNNVELPVLPFNQMYGYDERTGEMVVMENRAAQNGQ